MSNLLIDFKLKLLFCFSGVMEHPQLEHWVYENKKLEDEIKSKDTYLDLISFDYGNKQEVNNLILKIYPEIYNQNIYIDSAILTGWLILNEQIPIEDGINALDRIEDKNDLPVNFSGLADEIDRIGLDYYKEYAIESVTKLLDTLDKNKKMQTLFSKKMVE